MKRRWCTITRKKFHDGNNIEAKIYITRIACNSRTAFQTFEIFSTHFRRGIFTFHEGGGGGDRGIALHGVKRYPQRRFRYMYIYIYMYQACYNLGMRGGKDEFAIHVPRGVFGAGFESQIPRKVVSPPGFVEGRPLIWKLHATSPRNAFKFDHSIY